MAGRVEPSRGDGGGHGRGLQQRPGPGLARPVSVRAGPWESRRAGAGGRGASRPPSSPPGGEGSVRGGSMPLPAPVAAWPPAARPGQRPLLPRSGVAVRGQAPRTPRGQKEHPPTEGGSARRWWGEPVVTGGNGGGEAQPEAGSGAGVASGGRVCTPQAQQQRGGHPLDPTWVHQNPPRQPSTLWSLWSFGHLSPSDGR